MCGIFIVVSKTGETVDLERCRSILRQLKHRGPDLLFDSLQNDDRMYMGQTVLSITGTPDQALRHYQLSKSGRFNLVLNGEIYNHRELAGRHLADLELGTGTDAEALVNLYDRCQPAEVASCLRGMYAFGLYDRECNQLYIARDLIGEKCIYTYEDSDTIIFASETTAINAYLGRATVNKEVIKEYFFTRHLLTPATTLFTGIDVYPAGVCTQIDLNSGASRVIHQERLSDLVDEALHGELSAMPEADLLDELERRCSLTAAMLKPNMPYASVFSGGIDSSLASWFMGQQGDAPWLVTLQFGDKDAVSKSVGRFEEKLGRPVFAHDVGVSEFTSAMKRYYGEYRYMMATHSFVSQLLLSEIVSDHGYRVLIGGDGADELFGGYEYYKNFSVLDCIPVENPSPYSGFVESEARFADYSESEFRRCKQDEWQQALELYAHVEDGRDRTLQALLYLDSLIEMETVGLRCSDLMSMANSVEGRSFFVTRDILEFIVNVPASMKIDLQAQDPLMVAKPLLKKLFVRCFGRELLFEKQGYSGHPNEAASRLIGDDLGLVTSLLGLDQQGLDSLLSDRAMEWKLMNTELFLRTVSNNQPDSNP